MRYLPQYREAIEKKLHLIFVPQIKKHRMTNTVPGGGGTADWKYVTKKMGFMAAPQTKKHRAINTMLGRGDSPLAQGVGFEPT